MRDDAERKSFTTQYTAVVVSVNSEVVPNARGSTPRVIQQPRNFRPVTTEVFTDTKGNKIQAVPFKMQPSLLHMNLFTYNIEFVQQYRGVAADAALEIRTAVIPVVLLRDEHLSQTDTSFVAK
jgi:hypothetical protein